ASIILDVDQLINTAVNLIRDKFEVIYYVGLFLIDDARKWAVLRAGTGEAGRLQIEAGHRLPVGGGSMIGWSVQNQKPRIDLDVGGDAEHFKRNKYLPDTRSELALPLISGQMAIGALTVQSTQPNAFTTEDISLLQTLADQLANAIANADLFENIARTQQEAEARLKETVALQEFSQSLSTTLQASEILDMFFQVCLQSLGFEYVVFSTVNKQGWVQAVAGRGVSDALLEQTRYIINGDNFVAEILRTGKTKVITGWVEGLNRELFESEMQSEWIRLFTPITLLQRHIGLVEVGYKSKHVAIEPAQQRMLQAFIDQAVLALDNAQRYEASQRTAQREAIIREITSKIRTAVDVNDILQTTINELSLVLGANRGSIKLAPSDAMADPASPLAVSENAPVEK
ncbi:MAG: GAF domain-containing protein, partial [Anaerolineae bacterium]|nr:GAF domain-containing protein [Anaerolineae bacterium]